MTLPPTVGFFSAGEEMRKGELGKLNVFGGGVCCCSCSSVALEHVM